MRKVLFIALVFAITSLQFANAQNYNSSVYSSALSYEQSATTPAGYATFGLSLTSSTAYSKTFTMYLNLPPGITHANCSTINAHSYNYSVYDVNVSERNDYGNISASFTVYTYNTNYDVDLEWAIDYEDGTWQYLGGNVNSNSFYSGFEVPTY